MTFFVSKQMTSTNFTYTILINKESSSRSSIYCKHENKTTCFTWDPDSRTTTNKQIITFNH